MPKSLLQPEDAERALLGAALASGSTIIETAGDLRPEHFGDRRNAVVWASLQGLASAGAEVGLLALKRDLEGRQELGLAGGPAYISGLVDGVPRYTSLSSWAGHVRDSARRRRLRTAGAQLMDLAENGAEPERVAAFLDRLQRAIDAEGGHGHVLIDVCGVETERVEWLWIHRLPFAKLAVLDGDPGLGKSTLTLELAARLTAGRSMPGDDRPVGPAGVVLLTGEDGIGDTIRPRLEAAGADLGRVAVLTAVRDAEGRPRPPILPDDVEAVRRAVKEKQAALVVIDPLMAFLNGKVDSHRDQDVRGALHRLVALAEDTRAAVVVVRHLNKSQGGHPIYRGSGSIGIIGAVRAGLLVAPDPRDETRRVLAVSKSNLGPVPPSLAYRIEAAGDTSRISWEGVAEASARDLLVAQAEQRAPRHDAVSDAVDFLQELLADGPLAVEEVKKAALAAGFSWRGSVERARAVAGVRSHRLGGLGAEGRWYLELAPNARRPLSHAGVAGDSDLAGLSERSSKQAFPDGPETPLDPKIRSTRDGGDRAEEA